MAAQDSGFLAAEGYAIPDYMLSKLLLQSDREIVRCHGERGQFDLEYTPAARIVVRWGAADGPALIVLGGRPGSLGWAGQVAAGGFVDAIHLCHHQQTGRKLGVIFLGGQPMKHNILTQPIGTEFALHHGLAADLVVTNTIWITDQTDPMLSYVQDALFHNTTVQLTGRMLAGDDPLVNDFDLPVSLESITVFSP